MSQKFTERKNDAHAAADRIQGQMTDKLEICIICRYSNLSSGVDWDTTHGKPMHTSKGNPNVWRNCVARYEKAKAEIETRALYGDRINNVGWGWTNILVPLTEALILTDPHYQIYQIKEKFGGLRFYVGGMSELGHTIINWAEAQSYTTCEGCGMWGKSKAWRGSWVKTLCTKCAIARYGDETILDDENGEED